MRCAPGSACRRSDRRCSCVYQLDLVTPGSSPWRARSRKQIRHSEKRRMNARGRPQTTQRWYPRTLNFGVRFALAIRDFLAMCSPPRLRGEGHAEEFEHPLRLLVGLRRRHDADLQPAETVDLVVIDLGKRDLLAQPEGVIAAPVERPAGDPAEVADPGQGEHRQALEEVPHPATPEGDLQAHGVARPDLELGDRLLGLGDDRLLAGDRGHVAKGRVEGLCVCEGLAETDVDDDLRELRDLVRIGIRELLHQGRDDLDLVAALQRARRHFDVTSIAWPQWVQVRTRRPSSRTVCRIRVGLPHFGQTSMTFEIDIGRATSMIPPCWTFGIRSVRPLVWRGFVWRFAVFRPSDTTQAGWGDAGRQKLFRRTRVVPPGLAETRDDAIAVRGALSTLPRLPASLPLRTPTGARLRSSGSFTGRMEADITAPPGQARRSSCSSGP